MRWCFQKVSNAVFDKGRTPFICVIVEYVLIIVCSIVINVHSFAIQKVDLREIFESKSIEFFHIRFVFWFWSGFCRVVVRMLLGFRLFLGWLSTGLQIAQSYYL